MNTFISKQILPIYDARLVFSIIITFNPDISDFKSVLSSHIKSSTGKILIIDNNSVNKKEIAALLESEFHGLKVELHLLSSNEGLGFAINSGISLAEKFGCTHVAIFDQDSTVPVNIIKDLLSELEALNNDGINVAAIGPTYFDSRTGTEYPHTKLSGLRLKKIFLSKKDSSLLNVSLIITSGSLIPINVIKVVGGMREDFFIDRIDIEWCFRAQSHNFKIYSTNKVTMQHSIGLRRVISLNHEISIHSPLRRYYMIRNSLALLRLPTIPLAYRIREFFVILIDIPRFLLVVKFKAPYIKMIWLGIFHGINNKLGKLKFTE